MLVSLFVCVVATSIPIVASSSPNTCPPGWMKRPTGCYTFVESGTEAKKGAANCKSHGGYLAEINSQEEQDEVWQMYQSSGETLNGLWIGGNDQAEEGTWVDHSGNALTYTNWAEPGPNGGTGENCIAFMITWDGKWNDARCTRCPRCHGMKALCEYDRTRAEVSWTDPVSACIWEGNIEIVNDVTLEECQEKCDSTTTFPCRSVEWSDSGLFAETCWMSNLTSADASKYLRPCTGLFSNLLFSEKIEVRPIDVAFCNIAVDRSREQSTMKIKIEGRPTATGDIDESDRYVHVGFVNFTDDKLYQFWYYAAEGFIYWGADKGKTENVWRPTDFGPCEDSITQDDNFTDVSEFFFHWSCEFCTEASSALVSHSTSTSFLQDETELLVSKLCPRHPDPDSCKSSLPTFWSKYGKLIWSGFWSLICVDQDCSSNDGVPEFWYRVAKTKTLATCSDCRERIKAHLNYLDGNTALNKYQRKLPEFCNTREDVEECNELGEWFAPDALTFLKGYYRQNANWITEICQLDLDCIDE